MIAKIKNFFKETLGELKKVSWSSREELIGATVIVLASTAILVLFIGVADLFFSTVIKFALK